MQCYHRVGSDKIDEAYLWQRLEPYLGYLAEHEQVCLCCSCAGRPVRSEHPPAAPGQSESGSLSGTPATSETAVRTLGIQPTALAACMRHTIGTRLPHMLSARLGALSA